MKRRIKEVTDSNGITKYIVQFRFLFKWITDQTFFNFDMAKACMDYKSEVKVKYHK